MLRPKIVPRAALATYEVYDIHIFTAGSNIMILVFFVSLYFLNLLQQQHIFRDLSPYRPCQELNI